MASALSMVGVGVASVLGALASTFWLVLVSRLLQGFAAGLIVAVYMPILAGCVRVEQRGRATTVAADALLAWWATALRSARAARPYVA